MYSGLHVTQPSSSQCVEPQVADGSGNLLALAERWRHVLLALPGRSRVDQRQTAGGRGRSRLVDVSIRPPGTSGSRSQTGLPQRRPANRHEHPQLPPLGWHRVNPTQWQHWVGTGSTPHTARATQGHRFQKRNLNTTVCTANVPYALHT